MFVTLTGSEGRAKTEQVYSLAVLVRDTADAALRGGCL
jgi:hypothetical protein